MFITICQEKLFGRPESDLLVEWHQSVPTPQCQSLLHEHDLWCKKQKKKHKHCLLKIIKNNYGDPLHLLTILFLTFFVVVNIWRNTAPKSELTSKEMLKRCTHSLSLDRMICTEHSGETPSNTVASYCS